MNKFFLITMLSLTMVGCDRQNKPNNPPQSYQETYNTSYNQDKKYNENYDNDNTGKNIRDRDSMTKTPENQSENETDRTITKRIRQTIMSDDALSTNAKNIKVITISGIVTLRGPVNSEEEKETIARKVKNIQGVVRVDNQIEVIRNNH